MSKEFEEQKQISAFDVVISALAILVCLPILPFNLLYIFLILKTNKKENFVLFPCVALLVILCTKMGVFLQETIQIAVTLVKGLFNHSFNISAYGLYSLSSWFILTAVSFAVASFVVKRIRYNRLKEQAGIISLERKFATNGGGRYDYAY